MKYLIIALSLLAGIASAQDADATTRERQRILIDTNTTTTVGNYSATGGGQLLKGKVGNTNAVWIATDSGTNHWVKIAQQ